MTEKQLAAFRAQLLTHRARLLDFAVQQVEADSLSFGWLRMLADAQLALAALDDEISRT